MTGLLRRLAAWLDGSLVTDEGQSIPRPRSISPDEVIARHLRRPYPEPETDRDGAT